MAARERATTERVSTEMGLPLGVVLRCCECRESEVIKDNVILYLSIIVRRGRSVTTTANDVTIWLKAMPPTSRKARFWRTAQGLPHYGSKNHCASPKM